MDIILIRHGESLANINKTFGGIDIPLSEKGILQAKNTKENIPPFKNKKIYTSHYKRAIETMEYLGLQGEIKRELGEVDFGIATDLTYLDFQNKYPEITKTWNENPFTFRLPKGESLEDAYKRVSSFLEEIIKMKEDTVLICHDGTIRLIISYILGSLEYFYRFKTDNLSFTKLKVIDNYRYFEYINRIYYK